VQDHHWEEIMRRPVVVLFAGVALVGCGERAQEARNTMNAMQAVAEAAKNTESTQDEAARFQEERRSRGDTVAMGYEDLQKFLPSAPSGYSPEADPSGSSQSMGAFSMATAEQRFVKPAGADGATPTLIVTLIDFGGTEGAYGMMALPMMMNLSQEDAHQRMKTMKLDLPYSWGSEEYNKDTRDAKFTVMTRYRYVITVDARHHGSDESEMVRRLAEDIARKFEGK
jgi:hypothetical protein